MIRWDIKGLVERLGGLKEVQKELAEEGLMPLQDKTYWAAVGRGSTSSTVLANLALVAKKKGITITLNELVSYWEPAEAVNDDAD